MSETSGATTPLEPKIEKMYEEIYKARQEIETYTHEIIWKAESYFTALVSGLITAGLSIAHFSLYAAYGILPVAVIITLLGRYVLAKESEYFHGYRYDRIKILEKLGYNNLLVLKEFPDFEDIGETRKNYIKKRINRKEGTRYAFRLIYLFQASVCLVVYWTLLVLNGSIVSPQLIDLANMSFIVILTIVVILWYGWEIKSVFEAIVKKLDP